MKMIKVDVIPNFRIFIIKLTYHNTHNRLLMNYVWKCMC
jgi:hypothetical protein